MQIHNVEIVSLYQNKIEYRKLKTRSKAKIYSIAILLLIPVLSLCAIKFYSESTLNSIYTNVCNLYNPIYSPYAETGSITFAGAFDYENDLSEIDMPILSSDIKVQEDGTIVALVKESILIKSVADGVVESIKDIDGVNVVNILYSNTVRVEYINLDVVGVNVGNIVKKGKEIGTAKLGEEVSFKAYINNQQVKGFKIENNKIIWPN